MLTRTLLLSAVLLMAAPAAQAATPTISGTYLFNMTTFCGLAANPWPDGVTTQFDGSYETLIAKATFDASTGQASISGISTNDQIIVPNSTGGKVNQGPYKATQAYANTSTTFTLNGQTYDVVYGKVVKGVVQQFDFSGTSTNGGLTSPNCVETGKATIS